MHTNWICAKNCPLNMQIVEQTFNITNDVLDCRKIKVASSNTLLWTRIFPQFWKTWLLKRFVSAGWRGKKRIGDCISLAEVPGQNTGVGTCNGGQNVWGGQGQESSVVKKTSIDSINEKQPHANILSSAHKPHLWIGLFISTSSLPSHYILNF